MGKIKNVGLLFIGIIVVLSSFGFALAQPGGGGKTMFSWIIFDRFFDVVNGDRLATGIFLSNNFIINDARLVSPGNKLAKANGPLEIQQAVLLEKPFFFEPLPGQPTTLTTILKDGVWHKTNPQSGNPPPLQIPVWDSVNRVWKLGNPPLQSSRPPSNPPEGYMYAWDGSQYVLALMQDMIAAYPLENHDIPFWNGFQWTIIKNAPRWIWGWDGSKYYSVVPAPWPMPITMPEPGKMWVWFGNAYTQIDAMQNPPPQIMQAYDIGRNQWVFARPPNSLELLPQLEPDFGGIEKAVVLLKSPPAPSGPVCGITNAVTKSLIIPVDASMKNAATTWNEFVQAWSADTDAKVNFLQQSCQSQHYACLAYRDKTICDSELAACSAQAMQMRNKFNADVLEFNNLFDHWYWRCTTYSTLFNEEAFCPPTE